jgi:hypothetical protein
LGYTLKLVSKTDDLMTKQIAKEEIRSNYLSFLHPFLEEQGDKLEELFNFKPSEGEQDELDENLKKRKVDEGPESEEKSSKEDDEEKISTPSKKRKLENFMGAGGRPLWEEVKSRSFAKGIF